MATKKKPAKNMGRPSKYVPEFCGIVIELGRAGRSIAQIAADSRIDVAIATIYEWASVHSDFSEALTRARDLALAAWEGKAEEGIEIQGFNAGLWGRIMSARFPTFYRTKNEASPLANELEVERLAQAKVDTQIKTLELEKLQREVGGDGSTEIRPAYVLNTDEALPDAPIL